MHIERIEPLATVPQYNGPQGGYHLWAALRARK